MDTDKDQCDCAWLLVYSLRPNVVHLGTPCTKMCVLSQAWPNHALDSAVRPVAPAGEFFSDDPRRVG